MVLSVTRCREKSSRMPLNSAFRARTRCAGGRAGGRAGGIQQGDLQGEFAPYRLIAHEVDELDIAHFCASTP